MLEQFKHGDFTGVVPVILKITPIADVRPLFGLAPEAVGTSVARVNDVSHEARREMEA